MRKRKQGSARAQFENCAWCAVQMTSENYGRYLGTVGALFMGAPATICKGCVQKEEDARLRRIAFLAERGCTFEHSDDDGWWGGRWHVMQNGESIAAHSYRDSAINEAWELLGGEG